MPANPESIRANLHAFAFERLFREDLGWDTHRLTLHVPLDGTAYTLRGRAQKRGLAVLECSPGPDGRVPDSTARAKIEREVAKVVHEHIVIYADAYRTEQVWQWVRREHGRPAARKEQRFHVRQSGEPLVQRLRSIAFELDEEESLSIPDVARRVQTAFNPDRVTKKFYDRFKTEHAAFLGFIKGITEQGDREWYASLMLNRLMFVYFIQKKGFLDDDTDYLRHRLEMTRQRRGAGEFQSFYRYFLLRLFHEGLGGQARDPELEQLLGRVPYLNGGLFDVHQLEESNRDLDIPDEAFEKVFDFFDEFRWHLDERIPVGELSDAPSDRDRHINPDVLGYIFEKYINQKQMGAYYTKEDITEYIAKNTIIPFLFDAARKEVRNAFEPGAYTWRLLQDDPDRYIYDAVRRGVVAEDGAIIPLPEEIEAGVGDVAKRGGWNRPAPEPYALPTETWREHVARRQRCLELRETLRSGGVHEINDLITHNLDIRRFAEDVIEYAEGPEVVRAFYRAIRTVTVLDPTCGSGAFLFAALNILEPLYEACLERMEGFVEDWRRAAAESHAVGADPRVRPSPQKFNDFRDILAQADKHPNRRHFILKSIILNNLYGVDIMEEAVEIAKLRLFLKLVAQVDTYDQIEPLPDIDFNIRAGNTLVGFATHEDVRRAAESRMDFGNALASIDERAEIADRAFRKFHEMQSLYDRADTTAAASFAEAKATLRGRLRALNDQLHRYLASEYGIDESDDPAGYPERFAAWRASHQPFHWFVDFYGIVKRGGFDVIIGNPPYVEMPKVRSEYQIRNYKTESCGNLYCPMMERGLALSGQQGRFGMIVPLSIVCTERMVSMRRVLESVAGHIWVSNFSGDANPSTLFEGVKGRLSIVLANRDQESRVYSTSYLKWFAQEREILFPKISYGRVCSGIRHLGLIPKIGATPTASVLERSMHKQPLAHCLGSSSRTVYVHRVLTMFIKCFDFVPYFRSEAFGVKRSEDYKPYVWASEQVASSAVAVLNSSTFFLYFTAFGDCFHCGKEFVHTFPAELRGLPPEEHHELSRLAGHLMTDVKEHAVRRVAESKQTGRVEYDEFWPRYSKPIIDQIDRVLARHYGFTDEELDFIINYDIKYRMGRDGGEGE